MILKIYKDDAPVLHKKSKEVKEITPEIKQLAEDMKETMYQAPGVGLAAPQVGKSLRLIVIDPSQEKNDFKALINPKLLSQKGPMIEGLEGCLSVSKWEGFVERYKTIKVSYKTIDGEKKEETFEDFPARVIQHEVDHLNGILFPEKVKKGRLYTKEEILKMLEEKSYEHNFFGSSLFSLPALNKLIENNVTIPLVVTQPDKPAGRGMKIQGTPVKERALELGLKVSIALPTSEELKKYSADYLVVVSYGKFIPEDIVSSFTCVNIHPSLLPKYRGPSPIQTTLLNGDTETGVTTMIINMEMDAGDILLQEKTKIDINEDYDHLEKRLADLGADLLIKTLNSDVEELRKKQDTSQATICKKIKKEDGLISWNNPPVTIHNKVRAIPAYTIINDKRIKILKTRFENDKLEILEVQPEGKKAMSYNEFKRGYQIEIPNPKYQ